MLNDSQYYPKLSGMFSRVSLVSDYRPSLPPPSNIPYMALCHESVRFWTTSGRLSTAVSSVSCDDWFSRFLPAGWHTIPRFPCYPLRYPLLQVSGLCQRCRSQGSSQVVFFSWLHILATQPPTSGTSRLPGRWLASVPSPSDYRWAHRPPNASVLAHCQHRLR